MAEKTAGPAVPAAVLRAYGAEGAQVESLGRGLINATVLVRPARGEPFVLQRLHPIFPGVVNEDIDAVTARLAASGLATPRVCRTQTGRLWVEQEGAAWRALTYVDGVAFDRLGSPAQAREAGALLARFHAALVGFDYRFRNTRAGVHDIGRHLANLRRALAEHAAHPRIAEVRPLAEEILELAAVLPPLPDVTPRIVHGDPKVNNIVFSPTGAHAICLVDLDTLARMALPLELGDAFRSWCNPAGEDLAQASFSLELFAGAVAGYAGVARVFIDPREAAAVVPATRSIYIELAARFCADALNESYFGWDPGRFGTRSEHNRVRAASQLNAARSLAASEQEALKIAAAAFAAR
jgi:Ser/Thr protein kinase RdoA (MazF antagonist)